MRWLVAVLLICCRYCLPLRLVACTVSTRKLAELLLVLRAAARLLTKQKQRSHLSCRRAIADRALGPACKLACSSRDAASRGPSAVAWASRAARQQLSRVPSRALVQSCPSRPDLGSCATNRGGNREEHREYGNRGVARIWEGSQIVISYF